MVSKDHAQVPVGFESYVNQEQIITVVKAQSDSITRTIRAARKAGTLVDCTRGRKARVVIFLKTGHIVLASTPAEYLLSRRMEGENTQ